VLPTDDYFISITLLLLVIGAFLCKRGVHETYLDGQRVNTKTSRFASAVMSVIFFVALIVFSVVGFLGYLCVRNAIICVCICAFCMFLFFVLALSQEQSYILTMRFLWKFIPMTLTSAFCLTIMHFVPVTYVYLICALLQIAGLINVCRLKMK